MFVVILEKTAKEIGKTILKSAAMGATSDALIGLATKKNPIKEGACGAVSSAAGMAAKEGFEHFVKSTGKGGMIAGVSASIVTRYAIRRMTEEEPPQKDNNEKTADKCAEVKSAR